MQPLKILTSDEDITEKTLPPYIFVDNAWATNNTVDAKPSNDELILKIVTYNVWFEDHYFHLRAEGLCDTLQQSNADILCLQEVTYSLLEILREQDWLRANYILSDAKGATVRPYGVLVITHKRVFSLFEQIQLSIHPLRSGMLRKAIIISLQHKEKENSLKIATAHFESLDNKDQRKIQMEQVKDLIQDSPTAVVLADFNFDDEKNWSEDDHEPLENIALQQIFAEYHDLWPHLNGAGGKTFDTDVNKMIAEVITREERMRYDRVLFKSEIWSASDIAFIGHEKYCDAQEFFGKRPVWVSDHFGLLCTIRK
jgi:endonuclease/exonuclease/phosphatase family metal-dependent hydrolase